MCTEIRSQRNFNTWRILSWDTVHANLKQFYVLLVLDSTHCESRHTVFVSLLRCVWSRVAQRAWRNTWTASLQSGTGWNIGSVVPCVRFVPGPRREVFTSENHNPGARDLELKRSERGLIEPGCTVRQLRLFAAANGPDVRRVICNSVSLPRHRPRTNLSPNIKAVRLVIESRVSRESFRFLAASREACEVCRALEYSVWTF